MAGKDQYEVSVRLVVKDDGSVSLDKVGKETKQLTKSIDRNKRAMKEHASATARSVGVLKSMGKGLMSIKGMLIGGVGVAAGLYLARKAMHAFLDEGDRIQKLSVRLGETSEFLSEMAFVADRSGIAAESLFKAVEKLGRAMGETRMGMMEAKPAFEELGILQDVLNSKYKTAEEIFPVLIEKMAKMTDESKKQAMAAKLMGRGGIEMLQVINGGVEAYEALRERAREFGYTMTKEMADRAAATKDAMADLNFALRGVRNSLAAEIAPHLKDTLLGLVDVIKTLREEGQIAEWAEAVYTGFSKLVDGAIFFGVAMQQALVAWDQFMGLVGGDQSKVGETIALLEKKARLQANQQEAIRKRAFAQGERQEGFVGTAQDVAMELSFKMTGTTPEIAIAQANEQVEKYDQLIREVDKDLARVAEKKDTFTDIFTGIDFKEQARQVRESMKEAGEIKLTFKTDVEGGGGLDLAKLATLGITDLDKAMLDIQKDLARAGKSGLEQQILDLEDWKEKSTLVYRARGEDLNKIEEGYQQKLREISKEAISGQKDLLESYSDFKAGISRETQAMSLDVYGQERQSAEAEYTAKKAALDKYKTALEENLVGLDTLKEEATGKDLERLIVQREKTQEALDSIALAERDLAQMKTETLDQITEKEKVAQGVRIEQWQEYYEKRKQQLMDAGKSEQEAIQIALEEAAARTDSILDGMSIGLQQWSLETQSVGQISAGMIKSTMDTVESSMSSAFMDMIKGTKDVGDAFAHMAQMIIDEIMRMAITMMIVRPILSGLGGMFSGGSGATGTATGAVSGVGTLRARSGAEAGLSMRAGAPVSPLAFAFAPRLEEGLGIEPGGIPAILHRGEIVLPADVVKKLPAIYQETAGKDFDKKKDIMRAKTAKFLMEEGIPTAKAGAVKKKSGIPMFQEGGEVLPLPELPTIPVEPMTPPQEPMAPVHDVAQGKYFLPAGSQEQLRQEMYATEGLRQRELAQASYFGGDLGYTSKYLSIHGRDIFGEEGAPGYGGRMGVFGELGLMMSHEKMSGTSYKWVQPTNWMGMPKGEPYREDIPIQSGRSGGLENFFGFASGWQGRADLGSTAYARFQEQGRPEDYWDRFGEKADALMNPSASRRRELLGGAGAGFLEMVFGAGGKFRPGGKDFAELLLEAEGLHAGGWVGSGSPGPIRSLPADVVGHAPRFHKGLAPDEFPAVLQRGEQVTARGAASAPSRGMNVNISLVNQSGQNLQAEEGPTRYEGEDMIKTIILKAAAGDMKFRSVLSGVLR